ncbi:NADH:ubiquinone oxidoreductase 18.4kD subunit [Beauveria brongniartii RCEF 3172]|uniref:NADH:ubiquinone oxidoreductase 18.4kD subunit n=1 Tax=Beauveria brongniartii RCEF 3172 TaxID=1081107 RepID=A0A167AZJ3_9HYPO|nr:NADH:ubiquinone oxidoreductase 18.4kD subunit [Beauveria brongniartii RCEF 3172]
MAAPQLRIFGGLARSMRVSRRAFSVSARQLESTVPTTRDEFKTPTKTGDSVAVEIGQAPNRVEVWSRNQKPRATAMTGPRFEQTDFELQPQPLSAMEMAHKQPVRWTHDRVVVCDGGGSVNHGHPKIYINTDKAEIATCNYCGTPFANEHHRKHLESLPATSYPLS